jgi:superoxide dismutase
LKFELPKLPYPKNALVPYISAETLEFHHERHHVAYLKKLNEPVKGNQYAQMSLEEIIKSSGPGPLFNNAAQHNWNHSFYWNRMMPKSGKPRGAIANAIKRSFSKRVTKSIFFGEAPIAKKVVGGTERYVDWDQRDRPMHPTSMIAGYCKNASS